MPAPSIDVVSTFRYMEDGSFNTVDDDVYVPSEDAVVSMLHLTEAGDELVAAWRRQLMNCEEEQPFDQFKVPVCELNADMSKNSIDFCSGKRVTLDSL